MPQKYKFIELSTGEWVQAIFEAAETGVISESNKVFDFKSLTTGETVQKMAFVDTNGNKINLFNG